MQCIAGRCGRQRWRRGLRSWPWRAGEAGRGARTGIALRFRHAGHTVDPWMGAYADFTTPPPALTDAQQMRHLGALK